jgi:diguanylate cyclase (GGDEF)-like protein
VTTRHRRRVLRPDAHAAATPHEALSRALERRADEVARTVLAMWQERSPDGAARADERVRDDVVRTTKLATLAVAEYLMTGGNASDEQRRSSAATGKAPLRDTISLADLTKLFLYWRDATVAVVREECARLGLSSDAEAGALVVVRAGSDGSIVRMAKQFDAERRRLQAELAEEQDRLVHQAFHDALTGLPNRRLFFDRLTHALEIATRRPSATALLFLDVDCFKAVNDTFGHGIGDRVLVQVAERISDAVRTSDTVARLGGDEFVVLCEDLGDPTAEALELARRISRDLAAPMPIEGHVLAVSASVGIAFTTDGADPDTFLMRADHAMYVAKRRGPGNHELWSDA